MILLTSQINCMMHFTISSEHFCHIFWQVLDTIQQWLPKPQSAHPSIHLLSIDMFWITCWQLVLSSAPHKVRCTLSKSIKFTFPTIFYFCFFSLYFMNLECLSNMAFKVVLKCPSWCPWWLSSKTGGNCNHCSHLFLTKLCNSTLSPLLKETLVTSIFTQNIQLKEIIFKNVWRITVKSNKSTHGRGI